MSNPKVKINLYSDISSVLKMRIWNTNSPNSLLIFVPNVNNFLFIIYKATQFIFCINRNDYDVHSTGIQLIINYLRLYIYLNILYTIMCPLKVIFRLYPHTWSHASIQNGSYLCFVIWYRKIIPLHITDFSSITINLRRFNITVLRTHSIEWS